MPYVRKDDLENLRIAGKKMSNWMFNLRQTEYFKAYKEDMQRMVEQWDRFEYVVRHGQRGKQ